jgi:meso-butanediol dehydrogenase / (S,S)-butanediol dehydrogenase / diacetyl reductase
MSDSTTAGPHRFAGKIALVTGAASGIGRATAQRLADEGAAVWCADINAQGVAETAAGIEAGGATVRSSAFDVTDPAACQALVDQVVADLGGLDVLANIAGIGGMSHFAEETPERFLRFFQVNALGPFNLCQAALPVLTERKGNILNLASTAGLIGQSYVAAYCASKHALVGLTRSMAIELGRTGVRINAVCPGGVNTAIMNDFLPPEGASMSLISRSFLVREMQEPESVAAMIAYVCSDEAYYVNGSILSIDGGTTAG